MAWWGCVKRRGHDFGPDGMCVRCGALVNDPTLAQVLADKTKPPPVD